MQYVVSCTLYEFAGRRLNAAPHAAAHSAAQLSVRSAARPIYVSQRVDWAPPRYLAGVHTGTSAQLRPLEVQVRLQRHTQGPQVSHACDAYQRNRSRLSGAPGMRRSRPAVAVTSVHFGSWPGPMARIADRAAPRPMGGGLRGGHRLWMTGRPWLGGPLGPWPAAGPGLRPGNQPGDPDSDPGSQ